ncbi:hypothetical protein VNO77_29074 [Canavalia gladiata]|uniref:RING-type domain-containing protein n=1 Tax=Canavalia gladiata TaxID=3824 RepID=A0AAN9QBH4_CANGL
MSRGRSLSSIVDKRNVNGICQYNDTFRASLHLHARILLILITPLSIMLHFLTCLALSFPYVSLRCDAADQALSNGVGVFLKEVRKGGERRVKRGSYKAIARINGTARLTAVLCFHPPNEKGFKMSWEPHMEVYYNNISYPYSTAGSFIEYFEGLTYEHVNFIFFGASHAQESSYPSTTSLYKSGLSEPETTSYYRDSHGYEVNHHETSTDEYRRPSENSAIINEQMTAVHIEGEEGVNNSTQDNSIECPRRHHNNSNDYQVIWQDDIDPDNMTYEELLELGEAVGTQSRGLSQEQISLLPVSKYKCGCFFFRKKSRDERCVICQMEYRRGDKRITLPCKHVYHASCANRWLTINKACPMCYTEVFADVSKHK